MSFGQRFTCGRKKYIYLSLLLIKDIDPPAFNFGVQLRRMETETEKDRPK